MTTTDPAAMSETEKAAAWLAAHQDTAETLTDVEDAAYYGATGTLPAVRTEDETAAVMDAWRAAADETPERVELLPASDRWAQMERMADRLARSPLLPSHIRSGPDPAGNMMVILLTAHDLGLSATVAMQKVHVIDGKPSMSAELMRMLIRRDSHDIWSETERDGEGRPSAVTWFGIRKDQPERVHEGRFTMADAAEAKLDKKDNWVKYREDMLSARATSRLARKAFEDCLAGVSYTPEELNIAEPLDEAPQSASDEEQAALRDEIRQMAPEVQKVVAERWKEAALGSVKADARVRRLYAAEVDAAWILLQAARDAAPEDAEIVREDDGGEPDGGRGQQADNNVAGTVVDPPFTPTISDVAPTPPVGSMISTYEGRPTEQVDLPACETDEEEPLVTGGPSYPPAPGQAAGNPSQDPPPKTAAKIAEEVKAMPTNQVAEALTAAGLDPNGAPKTIKKRLTDHLLEQPF